MVRLVQKVNFVTLKWKNGGGVTYEIARSDTNEVFGWRLSVAEVGSDGPFSLFPSHARILTVIAGNGMKLVGQAQTHMADFMVPARFSGAETIIGKLFAGPCRDFNLIFDPKRYSAEINVSRGERQISGCFAVYLVSGSAEGMEEGDLAFLDDPSDTLHLREMSCALLIQLKSNL